MADEQPIIIIKKKVHGGGHHGGAWKVAYADFVTAMMALFIVLWLLSSSSKKEQEEIGGYFRDPKGMASKHGTDKSNVEKDAPKKQDMSKLRLDLLNAINKVQALDKLKKQIEFTITQEGLRIELMEDDKGTFFESGSSKPTPGLEKLLQVLSGQLGTLPNNISVEGHTDAKPYANGTVYGNWELSSDRANVARRLVQANGVRANQVSQVRGFADQRLRNPDKPFDASNRRISLIVLYLPDMSKAGSVQDIAGINDASHKAEAGAPKEATKEVAENKVPVAAQSIAASVPQKAGPATGIAGLLSHLHKSASP